VLASGRKVIALEQTIESNGRDDGDSAAVRAATPVLGDDVDLWYVSTDRLGMAALRACHRLVSPEELTTFERLRKASPSQARQKLFGRAFLRLVLSQYQAVAPAAWRFARNHQGKPFAVEAAGRTGLPSFNLSHAGGVVVCALTRQAAVGVDVEDVRRPVDMSAIARQFFSAPEVAALAALPSDKRREDCFALWTLRESYLKATGLGLSVALDQLQFSLGPEGPRLLSPLAAVGDAGQRWQFEQRWLGPWHLLAVAVEANGTSPRRVRLRRFGGFARQLRAGVRPIQG
jgi:4'-phosphopantetheinyl transferase